MAANSNKVGAHGENGASFEESFARLQEVVSRLSAGNLSLQEALGSFEEGMMLADRCAQMLDQAELRVKQVSDKALRAGAAAVVELEEVRRGRAVEPMVVEIETIEWGIATREQGTGGRDQEDGIGNIEIKGGSKGKGGQGYPQSLLDELDPLFDDE